jgi:hypothetical protein
MEYLQILKAKKEAFEVARLCVLTELELSKSQELSFDNSESFEALRHFGSDWFFSCAGILRDRSRETNQVLKKIDNEISILSDEISLLSWLD